MTTVLHSLGLVLAALALTAGCTSNTPGNPGDGRTAGGGGTGGGEPLVVGGDRPVTVHVPPGLDPAQPAPLVLLLHGFGASGLVQEFIFRLEPLADERGFLYAHPDGTVGADDRRFWNATDACCDFGMTGVDDVAYLTGLVEEIGKHHPVDPKRVYFVGHSNGGYMSHRMACDRAEMVAAIGSLAGATWLDPSKCAPSEPVAALQIHGTADDTVLYEGENMGGFGYPSAAGTVEAWAKLDGCTLSPEAGAAMDLDATIAGEETSVAKYATGCKPGGAAELWTITGGGHVPGLGTEFAPRLVDWLLAHAKP